MLQKDLSSQGQKALKLIEFDEQEKLVSEIRKHPFGLFVVYFVGLFVTTAVLIAAFVTAGWLNGDPLETGTNLSAFRQLAIIIGVILDLLILGVTFIGGYLYQNNVLLVTSEKLAQVIYHSLFNRRISQLSIGDVQDVTVKQVGLLARLFNFGTIVIETAGEQQNLTFTYTPMPYEAAKAIVGAHEDNMKRYGN